MKKIVFTLLGVAVFAAASWADPVRVTTLQTPIQDDWFLDGWVEELSTNPHDIFGELISSQLVDWEGHVPCESEYLEQQLYANVQVAITNNTQRYFDELYYVGDVNTTFTNFDESVADVTPYHTNNTPGLAFRIDSIGENTPLVYESMNQDGIFEPGETWEFVIQEYYNTQGLPAHLLGSVGPLPYGAVAQASTLGDVVSSGSIITPEPATMTLLAVGVLALVRRRQ